MALKVIGTGTFGVTQITDTNAQSHSISISATETRALDSSGNIIGIAFTQQATTHTVEVLGTGGSVPEIGSTISGYPGYVTAYTLNESNSDFAKYTVTLTEYEDLS